MRTHNSIRSLSYLLCLLITLIAGCSQETTRHVFLNEIPTTEQPIRVASVKHRSLNETTSSIIKLEPIINTAKLIQSKTVWDRLLSLYALPKINNARIEKEVQRYLKNPEFLLTVQQRAEPYLYFILDEIEAKKIPGELALLPIVESAFKARAVSKSMASGLWQFMPATGRLFGLKQNKWYDGRVDIYTSTKAATNYLTELSDLYGKDWILALAAYNEGKGNIRKAIRYNKDKNRPTDYWSLSLSKEATDYVPKLLAIAKIFADTAKYDIPLLNIPNKPYFSFVTINAQLDLQTAATMANTSLDDFVILNPAFKRASTDPDGPYHLLVRAEDADAFKEKITNISQKNKIQWSRHKVKAGENLSKIARLYKTTVATIRNNNKLADSSIKAGQVIYIPTPLMESARYSNFSKQLYVVKKGDTFWEIARQFDIHRKDIANWNNISLTKDLHPGQKLIVKKG
jgi:membrane-bound lytic murein transglycosylase D